jgi:hypothetical protein
MVISYNQNLHLKIQHKKFRTKLQFISLYFLYYRKFPQQHEYENHYKSLLLKG